MHRRPEVKSLEDIGQGVEPDHLSGALGPMGQNGCRLGRDLWRSNLTIVFFLSTSTLSPSVLVLRLLTTASFFFSSPRSITLTFLISHPSSHLTQSSPGPLQSSPMNGITTILTCCWQDDWQVTLKYHMLPA